MISVLQDWRELGECIETLQRDRLPLHTTPQKNWDHFIDAAVRIGFEPPDNRIPDCSGAPVVWQGLTYTFIALLLRKPPTHRDNGR